MTTMSFKDMLLEKVSEGASVSPWEGMVDVAESDGTSCRGPQRVQQEGHVITWTTPHGVKCRYVLFNGPARRFL